MWLPTVPKDQSIFLQTSNYSLFILYEYVYILQTSFDQYHVSKHLNPIITQYVHKNNIFITVLQPIIQMNTLYKLVKDSFSKLPERQLTSSILKVVTSFKKTFSNLFSRPNPGKPLYKPTLYLYHPFSQVVYNIAEKSQRVNYERERVFFEDGGHACLDWYNSKNRLVGKGRSEPLSDKSPICFIMHGLTGGSESNYIKVLLEEAENNRFRGVCLNSRGIGTEMTSPKPFTWIQFDDLQYSLQKIKQRYPEADIYMIGTSFGSNYLTRYLLQNKNIEVKGFVGLGTPFNVPIVMSSMSPICQKFFVKRYISETILKHPLMKHWHQERVINVENICKATNLKQFYNGVLPLTGMASVEDLFNVYSIGKEIKNLNVPTLFINSQDDPIVTTKGMPIEDISSNPNIKYMETSSGGHLCWFEGMLPRRWYPKPTFSFLKSLRLK